MEYRTTVNTPLGVVTLASNGAALTGLWLEGQKYFGGRNTEWREREELAVFDAAKDWLRDYFAGRCPDPSALPLAPYGTPFQQRIWQQLLTVPYGVTVTYGDLARAAGCTSARAAGSAVGRNPISLIIPCHRVVGSDGSLTGYAGGIERKRWLLRHECRENGKEKVSRQE